MGCAVQRAPEVARPDPDAPPRHERPRHEEGGDHDRADRERERRRLPRRAQPGALAVGRPGLHPADGRDERPRRQLVLRHGVVPEGLRADRRDRPRRSNVTAKLQGARPAAVQRAGARSRTRSRACASSGARSRTTSTTSRTGPATRTSTSAAPTSTRRRRVRRRGRSSPRSTGSSAAHRKPFAAPEWGLYGVDDPQFVQDMCTFLKTHHGRERGVLREPAGLDLRSREQAEEPRDVPELHHAARGAAAVVGGRRRGLREGRRAVARPGRRRRRTSRSRSPRS